jgi:hypothetical protein
VKQQFVPLKNEQQVWKVRLLCCLMLKEIHQLITDFVFCGGNSMLLIVLEPIN